MIYTGLNDRVLYLSENNLWTLMHDALCILLFLYTRLYFVSGLIPLLALCTYLKVYTSFTIGLLHTVFNQATAILLYKRHPASAMIFE